MKSIGYIISFTTAQGDVHTGLTVLKTADGGQIFFGTSNETVSTTLLALAAGDKSIQEITAQLQAIQAIHDFCFVAVSKPIKQAELSEVRQLLAYVGINASNVSDEKLTLFIESKIEGEYIYYMDTDFQRKKNGLFDMNIKRLEEHPEFSSDWLKSPVGKKQKRNKNAKGGFEKIETRYLRLESIEKYEPEPPPPPPANLNEMTDEQIIQWIRKNDSRNLEEENTEIKRSSDEVKVTIKHNTTIETLQYKMRK